LRSLGRGSSNSGSSFRKILSRPFYIDRDINKYSQELDWKQTERRVIKFEKTAFGRWVPGMEVKGNAIKFSVMWEAEKKALKNVDWLKSPLFSHFETLNSRKLNAVTSSKSKTLSFLKQLELHPSLAGKVYSDVELEYIISLIRKTQLKDGFTGESREAFIMRYFNKTFKTL
jgi:hypothetical protein